MQKDRLEEKLRANLGEYPSPLDLEGAWSQLERTRNKKKRGGIWLWWLGGVGAFVCALGLVLIVPRMTNTSQEMAGNTHQTEGAELVSADKPIDRATMALSAAEPSRALSTENATGIPSKRATKMTGFLEEQRASMDAAPEPSLVPASLEGASEKSPDPVQPGMREEERRRIELSRLKMTDRQRQFTLPSINISPEFSSLYGKKFEALPLVGRRYRRKKSNVEGLWIGFSGTIGIQDRKLGSTETSTAETEALIDRRNSSEEALEIYSFGFDLRKTFSSNWYFQTGLRHQIGFEHFEDQYERTFDKILEDQLTEIIQRADGSVTEIRGPVNVTVTESVRSSIYNTQNMTEIPILIGYDQRLINNLGFDLNFGLLYGLIQRKEGQIHGPTTNPGEYQPLSQLPYRRSNIWGGQLQGTISYTLGDRWVAFGGVQAKRYFNLVQTGESFFERQLNLNAVIGLRLQLQ